MSINFQQSINQHQDQQSTGGLLISAIFGGLSSELGQAIDTASDAAEIASELHVHYKNKAGNQNFIIGKQKSLGGLFSTEAFGQKPDIQKHYYDMDYRYNAPKPSAPHMAA